jgi:hypothetical protein
MHIIIYSSCIQNSQNLEGTMMSFNRLAEKLKIMIDKENGILFRVKKIIPNEPMKRYGENLNAYY